MNYWWIPLVIFLYALQAWLSKQNLEHGGYWFWILTFIGIIPLWSFVSSYTKNMLLDAMLYDTLMVLSFALSTLYFSGKSFGYRELLAIISISIGIALLTKNRL